MSDKIDGKKLRNVAGAFATGITIVTTENSQEEIIGITINSFVSISLDPALVGFFVKNEADVLAHLEIGKKVSISILNAEQKMTSNQFAGMNKEDVEILFDSKNGFHKIQDAMAWYETEVAEIQTIGDHQIIVCKVLDLDRDLNKSPILYFSGYKSIGKEID